MKKISLIMLLLLATAAVFASSLPGELFSVKGVYDYRKMTTSDINVKDSVNTLMGAGVAFDYDYYFNDYIGVYTTISIIVPVKSTIDGTKQSFEDSDFPVSAHVGTIGRLPFSSFSGLDLRLGLAVVYDKSTLYYPTWYNNLYLSKIETQLVAGLGIYSNFDNYGNFGVRVGANLAYTVYTGLYIDSRYSSYNIGDYSRTGYEIMPYAALTFGF